MLKVRREAHRSLSGAPRCRVLRYRLGSRRFTSCELSDRRSRSLSDVLVLYVLTVSEAFTLDDTCLRRKKKICASPLVFSLGQ